MTQSIRRDAEELQLITGGHWSEPVAVHASSNASRQREVMGEYELVGAVLREAIREYQRLAGLRTRRGERAFREIDRWFLADDRHWHFSFINLCEILNLEPTYIRTGLKIWREREIDLPKASRLITGEHGERRPSPTDAPCLQLR